MPSSVSLCIKLWSGLNLLPRAGISLGSNSQKYLNLKFHLSKESEQCDWLRILRKSKLKDLVFSRPGPPQAFLGSPIVVCIVQAVSTIIPVLGLWGTVVESEYIIVVTRHSGYN